MEPSASLMSSASSPLGDALAAYLTIHDALASDTIEGVTEAARAFDAAFALAIQNAPADNPHVWHMRAGETSGVQQHAQSLAAATDIESARSAFGQLSAPFAMLIEAAGAPDGFDLVRHTCGMQPELPEDGVWLQRVGEVRNPYFGGAMQMCSLERSSARRTSSRVEPSADPTHGA
ncbi:MAG: hypothetical protein Rubg2KO_33350 [Rubricoccaceae bacterium]